ncbi:Squalene epoxidase [Neonectria punicea]|uniref:Squalene monooxygenase n=1 Tax=Neonectria punicea TaxID=979145 RepID=A0ABR1H6C5_9HYPO
MAPRYDAVIVGGGIAGCALAKALANHGRRVLVVERSLKEPDRIVGELLQPGGVAALAELGLGDCVEDIDAVPVTGYHMFWKGQEEASFWFCAPSPREEKPVGSSFHHGRFVHKLRRRISEEENVTVVEATVVEIARDEKSGAAIGVICGDEQRTEHYGDLVVLSDGATSNFRSQFLPYAPRAQSRFWGLELTDADLPYYGCAYGIIGSGPPMLIYQIGQHETRILIDVLDDTYESLGSNPQATRRYMAEQVLPVLPERIQPSFACALREGRLRSVPNRWIPSSRNVTPGLVVLGDALNMRHPLTGGGMTVALKDAMLLADLPKPTDVPSLASLDVVADKLKAFHWRRKRYAASLNILAQALYLLFVAQDSRLRVMQKGFIRYIQEGEKNFAEPVGIMGGYVESPVQLFYHFVRIAVYSIGLHLSEAGLLHFPVALLQSCMVFVSAARIILPSILDELRL